MARVWFVRHGESVANAEGWLAGHLDVALTEAGINQARDLREQLQSLRPWHVWTSDLQRAWWTAELAWDHRLPPPRRSPALRERHVGAFEHRKISDLRASGEIEQLLAWDTAPAGGESQLQLARRAITFLSTHAEGEDTLIFGHGGLIRCLVGLIDDVPTDRIGRIQVANVEVIDREVPVDHWNALLERLSEAS